MRNTRKPNWSFMTLSFLSIIYIFVITFSVFAETPTVTNVFDNTYIIDALLDISSQTGIPIVADSTVNGQVTMTFEDVPLEEALKRLLTPNGFVFKNLGSYYLVGAPDVKNPSFTVFSSTEVVKLRYAKAEAAAKVLADVFIPYVKADKDSNSIIITAPESMMARIKADLAMIDRQIPQIMIEALVVDVSSDGRKDLGLDWKWDHINGENNPASLGSSTVQLAKLVGGIEYIPAGGLNKFLTSINATVAKGQARVEANPRVATLDGQAAEIFIGRDRYYSLSTTTGTTTSTNLESIKTGISLKLLPKVDDNGDITVQIEPEVSDVVADTSGNGDLPVISRRKVSTTVRVKTGDSFVLGGLLQRVQHKVVSKIPILGDLPIFGALFSSTKTVDEEGEVLIIITSYIMDDSNDGRTPKLMMQTSGTK